MVAAKQRPQASQANVRRRDVTNSESLSSQATTQADLVSLFFFYSFEIYYILKIVINLFIFLEVGTYVSIRSFLT